MKRGVASRTAESMALFRALESARGSGDRLFDDRFAVGFLRPRLQRVVTLARRNRQFGRLVRGFIDLVWPGARTSGIARTRFIDDLLRMELEHGVPQVVILGAGFDCRAYRIPGIDRTRVFEVDHPDTSCEKQRALARALPAIPPHISFVVTDFNRIALAPALLAAGYDAAQRACFVWEGVTNYLTDDAVDAMFRCFGTQVTGSVVIFTYVHRRVLTQPDAFPGAQRVLRTTERLGEPWTFGFDPAELGDYLAARGLTLVSDTGASEYRARHLAGRGDPQRGYEFYRVAIARVAAPTG